MTAKRFTYVIDNGEDTFYDLSKNGEIMNMIDTEDMLNELNEENKQLKSFILSLASPDGRIWLSSGYGYRIDKILNNFSNIENNDGDVE